MFGFQPIAFNYTKTSGSGGGCTPVVISGGSLSVLFTVNTFGSYDLNQHNTGGAATSWFITLGSLPAGLSLNGSTGIISGTPTVEGSYSLFINTTNSCTMTSQGLSLTIDVGPGI